MPWSEEEDRVLKAGVEETTGENGTKDWEAVGTLLQQAGFFRTGKQARHRYARILNGQKKPGRNKCNICGQPKKGHSCTGFAANIAATGFSAAQIRKGRASAARRTAKVNEAQSPIVAEFAAMLDAAAFSAEPTLAAEHAPAPAASRPITPMGDAASAAAPARSTVRSSSPSYGSQPASPPAPGKNFSFFSTLAQEMASVSTPATFALFDALATDAKVAPPDEPTPLDLDHVKRAKFSPPHEPAGTSFDGVPSLVDGNFLPAWI